MKPVSRLQWLINKISRELWLAIMLYSIASLLVVITALSFQHLIPVRLTSFIKIEATETILTILASSLLTVTTFSVTTIVAANNAVRNSISPRASVIVLNDRITQNALGSFIGGFIFSLISIIALKTDFFDDRGHIILFFFTIFVTSLIVIMLLRWVNYVISIGKVNKIPEKLEVEIEKGFAQYSDNLSLGCHPLEAHNKQHIISTNNNIMSPSIGYVQHIDVEHISTIAKNEEIDVYILSKPGDFIVTHQPIISYSGKINGITKNNLVESITINNMRTFDYDPEFGLIVLSEVALRALSPGINDPGTAVDIITRLNRCFYDFITQLNDNSSKWDSDDQTPCRVWMEKLDLNAILENCFLPIARDGRDQREVLLTLQRTYNSLNKISHRALKKTLFDLSEKTNDYALKGQMIEAELEKIKQASLCREYKEINEGLHYNKDKFL